jgi:hypothetical protein
LGVRGSEQLILLVLAACSGQGEDSGGTVACPPDVPADWDCAASACEGSPVAYRSGAGTSTVEYAVSFTEDWFIFWPDGRWCTDSFDLQGGLAPYPPENFSCADCEEIYEIDWLLSSGNSCGITWGEVFIDLADNVGGPIHGMLMFDTHSGGVRRADDALEVTAAAVEDSYYYAHFDYGDGTATPTGEADGPPSSYTWTGGGQCLPYIP